MKRLDGKIAIVTGGTSGIGKAIAERFSAEGASVVFSGRNLERGKELETALRKNNREAIFVQGDLRCSKTVNALVSAALDQFGRIDVLVNNAGRGSVFQIEDMDEDRDYDTVFDLNVRACFRLCGAVLPHMRAKNSGAIVNISSIGAITGMPDQMSYAASKAAVLQLTRSIAVEYADKGIRCNAVLPGLTNTGSVPPGSRLEKKLLSIVPMKRAARGEEIAAAALFFADEECAFCTGASLVVDGGTTCGPCAYTDCGD